MIVPRSSATEQSLQVAQALGISRPPLDAAPTWSAVPSAVEVRAESRSLAGTTVIPTLDVAMKEHIERALLATRGRIEGRGGAADVLAINPHTLRARMRKLQIDWSRFRVL